MAVTPRPAAPPPATPGEDGPLGLGGPLAALFWCACGMTAIPIAGLFAMIAAYGVSGTLWAVRESFLGTSPATYVLRLGLIPQLVLFVWAAGFVILTVARSRLCLIWAPWVLAVWVVVSAYAQFSIRAAIAPEGATISDFASLMPGLLIQAASVLTLYGYFSEGRRPRRFYIR